MLPSIAFRTTTQLIALPLPKFQQNNVSLKKKKKKENVSGRYANMFRMKYRVDTLLSIPTSNANSQCIALSKLQAHARSFCMLLDRVQTK